MNQRLRYNILLICSIITPIAFFFLPLMSISNYQGVAGYTYSFSLLDAIRLYQAQPASTYPNPVLGFLSTLVTLIFIAAILSIILSIIKKRIGVLITSLIGTLMMSFFVSIAVLLSMTTTTTTSYQPTGQYIPSYASVGLALWIPFIAFIVNLLLAATDCKIVYTSHPSYPGYYPNSAVQNPYQQPSTNNFYAPQQPNQFQQTQQNPYGTPSVEPARYNPNIGNGTVTVVPPVAPPNQ